MDLRKALGLDQAHIGQEENTCSYEVYPATPAGQSEASAAATLEALRTQLLEHLLPFLRDYIWQRDRFALQLSTQRQSPWHAARRPSRQRGSDGAGTVAAAAEPPPHLWGCVNFGDNIEDEWFIVWLLLEVTRAFPGVCARVWDNDGEFLLIEAAYGLPRWLKPETAQNRVWLHGGAFHLVPLARFRGDPLLGATPSLAQALEAVRGSVFNTAAPQKMQAALLPRVSGYPAKAAEQVHVAHALVPARVAHLLREEPQLLAAAVEAFHYRDPDDVRAAARTAAFPPRDMVLVAARFSRCLYAQLALQEYAPPRGYPMPMPSDPQYKAAEVGLKLTAGFEMMYANRARFGQAGSGEEDDGSGGPVHQPAAVPAGGALTLPAQQGAESRATTAAAAAGGLAGLEGDAAWAAFRARLEASGYFRGEMPGSAQHGALLAAAVDSYRQTASYRASTAALAAPARRVDALLAQPIDPASFPPPEQLPPEGSEAWLQAAAQAQLEAELAQRQAEQEAEAARKAARRQGGAEQQARSAANGQGQDEGVDSGDEFDPGELAGRLRSFVDMMAGLEGAELPGEASAGGLGGGGGGSGGGGPAPGGVSFDEAKFAAELQRVLGLGSELLRGLEQRTGGGEEDGWSETSEEGSSFFSDGDEDEDSDDEDTDEQQQQQKQPRQQREGQLAQQPAAGARPAAPAAPAAAAEHEAEDAELRRQQEGWEADTATDSDDDAAFMQAYGQAMDAQLAGTRMVESFERAPTGDVGLPAQQAQRQGQERGGSDAPGAVAAATEEDAAEAAALRPIDIDLNLVNSLLASYGEQQGLPGPAGSLAGLLGLKLPDQPAG